MIKFTMRLIAVLSGAVLYLWLLKVLYQGFNLPTWPAEAEICAVLVGTAILTSPVWAWKGYKFVLGPPKYQQPVPEETPIQQEQENIQEHANQ